jgi:hypothetical protein
MNWKVCIFATLLCAISSPLYAQPTLSVSPGGLQSGNWVWDVDITPDLVLAGGDTPIALELGFRLTSASLVNVTNVNPSEFDYNNPGNVIFGWETRYAASNNHPEGIEINCTGCTITNPATSGGHAATVVPGTNNEIFAAMGSVDFTTPGVKHFLKIIALGPGNGGPSSSSIQWLGAYAVGKGRIAQLIGGFNAASFDLYSGSATQAIPEPASGGLLAMAALVFGQRRVDRCSKRATR